MYIDEAETPQRVGSTLTVGDDALERIGEINQVTGHPTLHLTGNCRTQKQMTPPKGQASTNVHNMMHPKKTVTSESATITEL